MQLPLIDCNLARLHGYMMHSRVPISLSDTQLVHAAAFLTKTPMECSKILVVPQEKAVPEVYPYAKSAE